MNDLLRTSLLNNLLGPSTEELQDESALINAQLELDEAERGHEALNRALESFEQDIDNLNDLKATLESLSGNNIDVREGHAIRTAMQVITKNAELTNAMIPSLESFDDDGEESLEVSIERISSGVNILGSKLAESLNRVYDKTTGVLDKVFNATALQQRANNKTHTQVRDFSQTAKGHFKSKQSKYINFAGVVPKTAAEIIKEAERQYQISESYFDEFKAGKVDDSKDKKFGVKHQLTKYKKASDPWFNNRAIVRKYLPDRMAENEEKWIPLYPHLETVSTANADSNLLPTMTPKEMDALMEVSLKMLKLSARLHKVFNTKANPRLRYQNISPEESRFVTRWARSELWGILNWMRYQYKMASYYRAYCIENMKAIEKGRVK